MMAIEETQLMDMKIGEYGEEVNDYYISESSENKQELASDIL